MLILFTASLASWTIIFQRHHLFKITTQESIDFENKFWSGIELPTLFEPLKQQADTLSGMAAIAYAGLKEFMHLNQSHNPLPPQVILQGTERAMRIAYTEEVEKLEQHLPFLATVGSTSPYVGLFGTVWGIMTSFQSLTGLAQQATIAMVAPGISEALVATAMGLFAAIPAVIAYNRYSTALEKLEGRFERFQENESGTFRLAQQGQLLSGRKEGTEYPTSDVAGESLSVPDQLPFEESWKRWRSTESPLESMRR
jgi:biopolymer transport protein TolQ